MIRHLILQIVILSLSLPALCSCREDDGPDGPGTPPETPADTEGDVYVSFTGKHFRLADGVSYEGDEIINWTDTVWQNDRAYNQLLLQTAEIDVENLSVNVTALSTRDSEIAAENITLYTVKPVAGDVAPSVDAQPTPRPIAYIYDALTEGVPSKLTAGESLPIWITVDIPDDTQPGTYSGEIRLLSGDKVLKTCKLEMHVTAYRLPNPREWGFHLDLWQFPFRLTQIISENGGNIKTFSPEHFELLRPFYSILADAGQKAITAYIKDGAFERGLTMIDWTRTAAGEWTFDYTNFDNYVRFMDEIGIDRQINCFSLAGWNNSIGYTDGADSNKYKYMDLPIGSDEFVSVLTTFLNDFASHLKENGWFERAVLYMDENRNDEMRTIVNFIRTLSSDWKIGLSGRYIDADIEREFYNYATIIGTSPSTTAISIPLFYTSCSQLRPNCYLTPLTSPAEMTWMAWHAMAKGFKGYQRWAFDYWTRPDVFDGRDRANTAGDFHIIYRSSNSADAKPVNSIRMHMLRDGIQDYEKARIIGHQKLRTVMRDFTDSTGDDASAVVKRAQSEIKKLSSK